MDNILFKTIFYTRLTDPSKRLVFLEKQLKKHDSLNLESQKLWELRMKCFLNLRYIKTDTRYQDLWLRAFLSDLSFLRNKPFFSYFREQKKRKHTIYWKEQLDKYIEIAFSLGLSKAVAIQCFMQEFYNLSLQYIELNLKDPSYRSIVMGLGTQTDARLRRKIREELEAFQSFYWLSSLNINKEISNSSFSSQILELESTTYDEVSKELLLETFSENMESSSTLHQTEVQRLLERCHSKLKSRTTDFAFFIDDFGISFDNYGLENLFYQLFQQLIKDTNLQS